MDQLNEDGTETPEHVAVGPYLKSMREKASMRIEDVAADTRIPLRHLKAIEANDYTGLPGKTYATGFVRAYARTLGLDDAELVARLRDELGSSDYRPAQQYEAYEPVDPARIPPKKLAWTVGIVVLLLMAAYGVWRAGAFSGENEVTVADTDLSPDTPAATAAGTPSNVASVADNAEVVIAATAPVWFRIDDATGKRVHETELKAGDRYVVPAGSKGLIIRTSRPQAMTVTVGGQTVPQLGAADTLVKNISLDPAELAKRLNGAAAAVAPAGTAATPVTTPAAGADLSD